MPTITANGTTLYYERRGAGPPLLFISGAPGDAGHWTDVADLLADEYTVVSYDRRANSRSSRPEDYTIASIDQQADDAAALLEELDLAPAVVYGNSAGGIILANLAMRRPDVLRGAVFHEPAFAVDVERGARSVAGLQQLLGAGMAQGGPPRAIEMFLRWAAGDEVYESFDPDLRARMLGNGEVLFGLEMEQGLSACPRPNSSPASTSPSSWPRAPTTGIRRRPTTGLRGVAVDRRRPRALRSSRRPGRTCRRSLAPAGLVADAAPDPGRARGLVPGGGLIRQARRPDPTRATGSSRCRGVIGPDVPNIAGMIRSRDQCG